MKKQEKPQSIRQSTDQRPRSAEAEWAFTDAQIKYRKNRNQRIIQNLKRLREERGISQEHLAFAIGVHVSQIGWFETGRRSISEYYFVKIADYFGVHQNEFYKA